MTEDAIVTGLNSMFDSCGIDAFAYRQKQHRFSEQFADINVDSRHPEFYLAIEVKSLDLSKGATHLYFSQHFHQGSQLSKVAEFCARTGRKGLLAVALRRGVGRELSVHLLPWEGVMARVRIAPGWRVEEIEGWPRIPRNCRHLEFEPGMFRVNGGP